MSCPAQVCLTTFSASMAPKAKRKPKRKRDGGEEFEFAEWNIVPSHLADVVTPSASSSQPKWEDVFS